MSIFGQDLPPPVVDEVPSDGDSVAVMAAKINGYVHARNGSPVGVEVPFVRVAGALLGAVPLKDAVSSILSAMSYPSWPCDYDPPSGDLAEFAAAVNEARKRVHAYSEDCWVARRVVLLDWIERADTVLPGSAEWDEAMTQVSAVVAEAEGSELRLTIFEEGVKKAIRYSEEAVAYGVEPPWTILSTVCKMTRDVTAAGVRHSAPSMTACVECE